MCCVWLIHVYACDDTTCCFKPGGCKRLWNVDAANLLFTVVRLHTWNDGLDVAIFWPRLKAFLCIHSMHKTRRLNVLLIDSLSYTDLYAIVTDHLADCLLAWCSPWRQITREECCDRWYCLISRVSFVVYRLCSYLARYAMQCRFCERQIALCISTSWCSIF